MKRIGLSASTSRRVAIVAAAVVVVAVFPAAAAAHSFLIRSTPAAGERLAASPPALSLYFSEPFVRSSERITIAKSGGGRLMLAAPTSKSSVIHQRLPPRMRGVFVVS